MKQILKYLLFLMIGIIIYILYNGINGFSVGIESYKVTWGEIGGGAAQQQFDTYQEAEDFYTEYHLDDYTYPNMAIYLVHDDGEEELIEESPRQPSPTAEEGVPDSITIRINTFSRFFQLEVPPTITLQQLRERINVEMRFPRDYKDYRLRLNDTGGIELDYLIDTLLNDLRNLKLYYQRYRQTLSSFTKYDHIGLDTSSIDWQQQIITNIQNMTERLNRINRCVYQFTISNRIMVAQFGQFYNAFIQLLNNNQINTDYPSQENFKITNAQLNRYPYENTYLVDSDTLQYRPYETNLGRFNRVFQLVNPIIITNIESINRNIERYRNVKNLVHAQSYLESINLSFQNIYRLLNLLFDMLDDIFIEPRLVDVLVYFNIQQNGLSLILRLPPHDDHHNVCASEDIPPKHN